MFISENKLVELGRGATSVVYKSYDEWLRRWVAVKVYTGRKRREFEREYLFLKELRHPNWVEVYDFGYCGGRPCYTMELMDGGSLKDYRVYDIGEFVFKMIGVFDGIHHLHRRGYVHGDLKPANILYKDGKFKIVDPGSVFKKEGYFTIPYAAPEVINGEAPSLFSDYFSLGVILYEKLTGRMPFGETISEIFENIQYLPPSPREYRPDIPEDLNSLIMTLLSQFPEERYIQYWELRSILLKIAEKGRPKFFLLPGVFVDRRKELNFLKRMLRNALDGEAQYIEIRGDRGTGKSALLLEFLKNAQVRGFMTFYLRNMDEYTRVREVLIKRYDFKITSKIPSYDNPLELLKFIKNFLAALQRVSPVLIVVDPFTEDEPFLRQLLEYLSQSFLKGRFILAVANCGEPLSGFQSLELGSLSRKAFNELLRYKLPIPPMHKEEVEYLYDISSGNPGRLTHYLAKLVSNEMLLQQKGAWFFKERVPDLEESVKLEGIGKEILGILSIIDNLHIAYIKSLFGQEGVKVVDELINYNLVAQTGGILKRTAPFKVDLKEKKRSVLESLLKVIERENPQDYRTKYRILVAMGENEEALNVALRIIKANNLDFLSPPTVFELLSPIIHSVDPIKYIDAWRLFMDASICTFKNKEIAEIIERAKNEHPECSDIYEYFKATVLMFFTRSDEAIKILESLMKKKTILSKKELLFSLIEAYALAQKSTPLFERYIDELHKLSIDDTDRGRYLMAIGYYHYHNGERDKAIKYYRAALEQYKKQRKLKEVLRNLHNLADSHFQVFDYDEAEQYGNMGLVLARRTASFRYIFAFARILNEIYSATLYLRKSIRIIKRSLNFLKSSGNEQLMDLLKYYYARNLSGVGKLEDAIALLEELAQKEGYEEFLHYGGALAYVRALYHMGRFQETLDFIEKLFGLVRIKRTSYYPIRYYQFLIYLERGDFERASLLLKETEGKRVYETFLLQWYIFNGKYREALELSDRLYKVIPYENIKLLVVLEKAFMGILLGEPLFYHDELLKVLDILKRRGANYYYSQGLGILGMIYTQLNSWDLAIRYNMQVDRDFRKMKAYFMLYKLLPFEALALYCSGKDRKKALELLDEWDNLRERMGIKSPMKILRSVYDEVRK